MMFWTWIGWASAADPNPEAAPLTVDAKVPVEILLEGVKLGQLFFPAEITYQVAPGPHVVRIYTNGNPTDVPVDLKVGVGARIIAGRTGISVAAPTDAPAAAVPVGPVPVEFRYVGNGGAQLRIDNTRPHSVQPGQDVKLDLQAGVHPMSIRSTDGTVIWASGSLEILAGQPIVVQIGEGRMPEVSGSGAFHAGGG